MTKSSGGEGPAEPYTRSRRAKHLERAHRNLDKLEANNISPSQYAAALAAAADAYISGWLAAGGNLGDADNPFMEMGEPS